jgi:2-keto-4-pentenoate hydratase
MLHHVPSAELQDRIFAEARRVLAPGGVLAGSDSLVSTGFRIIHIRDVMVPVDPRRCPAACARPASTTSRSTPPRAARSGSALGSRGPSRRGDTPGMGSHRVTVDERVVRGMRRQLDLRHERLAAGARQIGWKLGFGSPAGLASLRLHRPLVGFLLDTGLLEDGATVSLEGWHNPRWRPRSRARRPAGLDRGRRGGDRARRRLPPPEDVETVLAGDVFTRHVMLGPLLAGRTDSAGVVARILVDGAEVAAADDATALVGELGDAVRNAAATLADCGEALAEGQVLMTGSILAPLPVQSGQQVEVQLSPLGTLRVGFLPAG